jgi:hypothetical protein
MGMTLRMVLSACYVMLVLLEPAQGAAYTTEAQRKVETERLYESIDWFLSIVEEVPEGIARQFEAVNRSDEKAFRQAIAHPLWGAHKIRKTGANIKQALRPWMHDTPEDRLRAAIVALQQSASFSLALSDYVDHDRGRRIINVQDWAFRYTVLPTDIAMYALCLLADLVSSRGGSGPPAAPR